MISFVAIMFTPTVDPSLRRVRRAGRSLGALAAVAVAPAVMRSRRNRWVFVAAVLFVTALSFASVNGWWYVSNFGVPWSNQMPAFRLGFMTVLLGLSVAALLFAAWVHFLRTRGDPGDPAVVVPHGRVAAGRRGVAAGGVRGCVADARHDRPVPAWSVGRSNLQALTGKTCGLATDVWWSPTPTPAC